MIMINRTATSRKNQNSQSGGKQQVLGKIAIEHHKKTEMKGEKKEKNNEELENFSKPKATAEISSKESPL